MKTVPSHRPKAGGSTNLNRDATGPDWVRDYAKKLQKQKLLQEKVDMEARLSKIRDRERKEKEQEESRSGISQRAKKRVYIVPWNVCLEANIIYL